MKLGRLAGLLAAPLLGLALWLGAVSPALAAAGPRFHVDAWGTREGLTANEIIAITQTRDGYLWLGTLNGLVRFDGVQFKVFDEHNTPTLPSDQIVYLFEDSHSSLWIGTQTAGALLLHDNQITPLGFGQGRLEGRLRAVCEDAQGTVWLRSIDGNLARFRDGKLESLGQARNSDGAVVGGHLLISDTNGMLYLADEELDPSRVTGPNPVTTRVSGMSQVDFLLASKTGGRWYMGRDGVENMVEKWDGDRLVVNLGPYPWGGSDITAACEDLDGNLVVGTRGAGVWWFDNQAGTVSQICQTNGLSGNTVLSLHVDGEGGLWVGLDPGGLNRVQRQLFQPLEASLNLTVRSVAEDAQGRLWFSSSSRGVNYWKDESVKTISTGVYRALQPFDACPLLVDRDQNIWAGTLSAGLFRWENNQFLPAPACDEIASPTIYALHQDRAGLIWAGTAQGLVRWDGKAWRTFGRQDGLSAQIVRALADDASGNLWIGTEGGGLFCLRDGKISPAPADLGFKNISSLYADRDGVLWIGTMGDGLVRLQGGHCVNYTTDTGLDGNGIDYLLDDDQGCLWLGSNAGLMRVRKNDLDAFARGTLTYIPCRTYTQRDGLPSDECTPYIFGAQPAACRASDGTLWFPTIAGLVPIDPSPMRDQSNTVPVLIESVAVEGAETGPTGPDARSPQSIIIPPGKDLVEIHYAALTYADPKRVRFQYYMDPYDLKPRDAGESRLATYRKLPPGDYSFQVKARNEDGRWSGVGATLSITVLPAFWQTRSFQIALTAGVLAALIGLVYYISTQKLQRQLAGLRQQRALEKDRARIARDIHDQVGASLTQLSLLGEMVESDKNDPSEVVQHASQITQTARETAHALDEIVWTVNPSNDTLEGLINYICKHAQEYLAVAGLRYRLEAPPQLPPAEISPEARHNVFLAAKESVTNIVKHAHATEACIRLRVEPRRFTLEIEDNGRGPAGAGSAAAQSRNGMRNMRKRMEDIGGEFEIGPGPKGGTLVRLTAPFS